MENSGKGNPESGFKSPSSTQFESMPFLSGLNLATYDLLTDPLTDPFGLVDPCDYGNCEPTAAGGPHDRRSGPCPCIAAHAHARDPERHLPLLG
jgi:hypothetical protein